MIRYLYFFVPVFLYPPLGAYEDKRNEKLLSSEKPHSLEGVGVEENLGKVLDKSVVFTNSKGEEIPLQVFFEDERPVVFSIVYYECPSLCNFHLNGLVDVFKKMKLKAGKDFKFVALSMDHNENSELAKRKLENYLAEYGEPEAKDFYFLTGKKERIKKIADQVGFKFRWDEKTQQYAHSSTAIILTPLGKISRYLHGIRFDVKNFKLALIEAGEGTVGTLADKFLLYCFRFDPEKNKYTLYAYNIMRLGGIFTVILILIFLLPVWLREWKRRAR